MRKISIILFSLLLILITSSCSRNEERTIDISMFNLGDSLKPETKIFYTHLNASNNDQHGTLNHTKKFYSSTLDLYKGSPNHIIFFYVEAVNSDSSAIRDFFEEWGYQNIYISKTKNKNDSGIIAISYILNSRGKILHCTNPSLSNFKQLMDN